MDVTLAEEDIQYEEDVLRNPFAVRSWWRYLEFKAEAPPKVRNILFERALKVLPGSYKLWWRYLKERRDHVRGRKLGHPSWSNVTNVHERCLVFMHKMPRIWLDYCEFLQSQQLVSRLRRTLDRALRSLPITQHLRIWPRYIDFVTSVNIPTLAVRVYRRYLKLQPEAAEEYIDFLESVGLWDEAATQLSLIVNADSFTSVKGRSKHQLWMHLCDLISRHPDHVKSLKVDAIIRSGLRKFSDEVGRLWTTLADYYIRAALFDKARDIFEEALNTVMTVRDFSQIWEAYAAFEDELIGAKMEMLQEMEADQDEHMLSAADDADAAEAAAYQQHDFELHMARYEALVARRPLMLNSVLLRQNPHNVHEWAKRVRLYDDINDLDMVVQTYTSALTTIDPQKAKGRLALLWIGFARFYEHHACRDLPPNAAADLSSARLVFEKAVSVAFRTVDELSSIWCAHAEMELRHANYEQARAVLRRATEGAPRSHRKKFSPDDSVQLRLHRSPKLWFLYADLEESLGTFHTTTAVYERMMELKVASPAIILNYATYLESHNHFEAAFACYEKGVTAFDFPHAMDLWLTYLLKFVARYGGRKLERARDLYEQVLAKVPNTEAKLFYMLYARLEEQHGLARHAMSIYDRATTAVAEKDRYNMFMLYINRATELFGVTRTRSIYERAMQQLSDRGVRELCLRYAMLELKLGEVDRARAIYLHASQLCDPRTEGKFWATWREFEVHHGNADTFRDMLRIKRSVQAQYNTQVNLMTAESLATEALRTAQADERRHREQDDMQRLERQHDSQQQPAAAAARQQQAPPGGGLPSQSQLFHGHQRGVQYNPPPQQQHQHQHQQHQQQHQQHQQQHQPAHNSNVDADMDASTRSAAAAVSNSEEMELADDDDAASADEQVSVVERAVPSAVFQGLVPTSPKET